LKEKNDPHFFSTKKNHQKRKLIAQAGQGVMARFPVIFLFHNGFDYP